MILFAITELGRRAVADADHLTGPAAFDSVAQLVERNFFELFALRHGNHGHEREQAEGDGGAEFTHWGSPDLNRFNFVQTNTRGIAKSKSKAIFFACRARM